jgi:pimeloyl-ACP methyl ester carboxylesterase
MINPPTRDVPTLPSANGREYAVARNSTTSNKVRAKVVFTPDVAIPILFIPGIMGSNLKVKGSKSTAWRPPNGAWQTAGIAWEFGGKSASDRQKLLDPNNTEVDDRGDLQNLDAFAGAKDPKEIAKARGWGTVFASSYHPILAVLEKAFNRTPTPDNFIDMLKKANVRSKTLKSGSLENCMFSRPLKPIGPTAYKAAANHMYPVYAVGYNWLQSNRKSGEHVYEEIKRIKKIHTDKGIKCEKVILVTHSMGGLVARACAKLAGAESEILGIVHGVMPAIGAAKSYKQMRQGEDGAASLVIGDGRGLTAVLTNSPGGMELLPNKQYSAGWLRGYNSVVKPTQNIKLPTSDPYKEIYREKTAWYKLVEPSWLDPAKKYSNPWGEYLKNLQKAEDYHDDLSTYYHPNTFSHYGNDAKQRSFRVINASYASRAHVTSGGGMYSTVYYSDDFAIDPPKEPGDGTVPNVSGAAPANHGAKQSFAMTGYDHQGSYSNAEAQAVTIFSILSILQETRS